jgi:ligand-binding sensor domain-containing protein
MRAVFSRILVLSMLSCIVSHANALDAGKLFSQYIHDHWGQEAGFLGGNVNAIAQSIDGYLWIGTDRGLVRFDGRSFRLFQHPIAGAPAIGPVRGLTSSADGTLWIRLDGKRLLYYRDGRFYDALAQLRLVPRV